MRNQEVLKSQEELMSSSHDQGLNSTSTDLFSYFILYLPFFSSASNIPLKKMNSPRLLRSPLRIQAITPNLSLESSGGVDIVGENGIESTGLRQRLQTKNKNEETFENQF
jgi:hypothetical protein